MNPWARNSTTGKFQERRVGGVFGPTCRYKLLTAFIGTAFRTAHEAILSRPRWILSTSSWTEPITISSEDVEQQYMFVFEVNKSYGLRLNPSKVLKTLADMPSLVLANLFNVMLQKIWIHPIGIQQWCPNCQEYWSRLCWKLPHNRFHINHLQSHAMHT